MERLDTTNPIDNSSLEASIHFGRYAAAVELVAGKKVLDLACGEGFGSYLLARSGATSVTGIDISKVAVQNATQNFKNNNLVFYCGDARALDPIIGVEKFDVIVSFETFEHIQNPEGYLLEISKLLEPGGTIMVSCPNDNFYYPDSNSSNPFHVKKYSLLEFKAITENALGKAEVWLAGLPTLGFTNAQIFPPSEGRSLGKSWIEYEESTSFIVRDKTSRRYESMTPSYWVGVWGTYDHVNTGSYAAISMETLSSFYENYDDWKSRVPSVETLERQIAKVNIQLAVCLEENRLLKNMTQATTLKRKPIRFWLIGIIEKNTTLAKKFIPDRFHESVFRVIKKILF